MFLFLAWQKRVFNFGQVCIATLFLTSSAKIIVASVNSTGTATADNIVVTVGRFNDIPAEVAANCVFDDSLHSSIPM